MKIALISPPYIPVPPPMYGGIELVIYDIIEGLSKQGIDVILFGPKSSSVPCRLIPYLDSTDYYFGIDSPVGEKKIAAELSSKYAYTMAAFENVDLVHDHTLSVAPVNIPTVHTLHGPATDRAVAKCLKFSKNQFNSFIFISQRQKELYERLNKEQYKSAATINTAGVVHNSIDVKNIKWTKEKEDFFFFIGRVNWEKGVDLAVKVASKAHIGLVMAIKMSEDFEQELFKNQIRPQIDNYPKDLHFELFEEITPELKFDLYRRARCTLFTSQWEEPFGLVMIESMACGTPVIALRRGAAPEIIIDGKTGFLVDSEEEMIQAAHKVDQLDPEDCRKHIEDNFSREKMAKEYISLYEKILSNY
ncbi:glycosyltransferase family 4 protein [Elusimicrobiota bacterium]